MIREHEVLANSLESVVENLDQLIEQAVKDKVTVEELIDRLDVYRHSLRRVAKIVKG